MDCVPLATVELPEPKNYYDGIDLVERPISRNALLFLRTTRRTLQQKHIANRMHHRLVLLYALEEGGVVSVDGKSLRLEPGEALLILPYQFHHYIDTDSLRLRWLFITFELTAGAGKLQALGHRCLSVAPAARHLFERITAAWLQADLNMRASVLPLLDQLLLQLLATTSQSSQNEQNAGAGGSNSDWIVGVERRVIESVEAGRTLASVARQIGLSERQVRSRFEVAMGISLSEYRANYQLHRAIALMRKPSLSLGQIAELCGFNSQSVFSRFITRKTQSTPRRLRRLVEQGQYQIQG